MKSSLYIWIKQLRIARSHVFLFGRRVLFRVDYRKSVFPFYESHFSSSVYIFRSIYMNASLKIKLVLMSLFNFFLQVCVNGVTKLEELLSEVSVKDGIQCILSL